MPARGGTTWTRGCRPAPVEAADRSISPSSLRISSRSALRKSGQRRKPVILGADLLHHPSSHTCWHRRRGSRDACAPTAPRTFLTPNETARWLIPHAMENSPRLPGSPPLLHAKIRGTSAPKPRRLMMSDPYRRRHSLPQPLPDGAWLSNKKALMQGFSDGPNRVLREPCERGRHRRRRIAAGDLRTSARYCRTPPRVLRRSIPRRSVQATNSTRPPTRGRPSGIASAGGGFFAHCPDRERSARRYARKRSLREEWLRPIRKV